MLSYRVLRVLANRFVTDSSNRTETAQDVSIMGRPVDAVFGISRMCTLRDGFLTTPDDVAEPATATIESSSPIFYSSHSATSYKKILVAVADNGLSLSSGGTYPTLC